MSGEPKVFDHSSDYDPREEEQPQIPVGDDAGYEELPRPSGIPSELPLMPREPEILVKFSEMPEHEMEILLTRVIDRVMQADVQKKITQQISAEFDKIAVQDVAKIANEVLGADYWEVMQVTGSIRRGEISDPFIADQALMALGGFYTPINVACGILWSQHKERHSGIIVDLTDRRGYPHNRASSRADVMCANIHRNASIMERLREGMLENINILKKVRDRMWIEWDQVQSVQPTGNPDIERAPGGVRMINSDATRPWRRTA